MHLQPAYAHLSSADACPVASRMAARVLSLPMGPYLDDASARRVAQTLLRALRGTASANEAAAEAVSDAAVDTTSTAPASPATA